MMAGGNDERLEMLKAFDQTQAGVKGLVDSGVLKVPQIFVRSSEEIANDKKHTKQFDHQVPVIDLSGIDTDPDRRKQIVEQVRAASGTWGFFLVVNHGIPQTVLDGMINGVQGFHEQDVEEKKKYFTRDPNARVRFISNDDLFNTKAANWRDSVHFSFPDQVNSEELPLCCRESTIEYLKHVSFFGNMLLEILSEGLGLKPDHLKKMNLSQRVHLGGHYYPACPEPELTLGTAAHTDAGFVNILLTDQMSGLQVLYQDHWVDVQHIHGGLIINIGDLLQLVSNGKYKSVKHRVVPNRMGPRISLPLLYTGPINPEVHYSPIKELISEENPAKYREVIFGEYIHKYMSAVHGDYSSLDYFKL